MKSSLYPLKYSLASNHDLQVQYKKRINKYAYIKKTRVKNWEYLSSEAHRKNT